MIPPANASASATSSVGGTPEPSAADVTAGAIADAAMKGTSNSKAAGPSPLFAVSRMPLILSGLLARYGERASVIVMTPPSTVVGCGALYSISGPLAAKNCTSSPSEMPGGGSMARRSCCPSSLALIFQSAAEAGIFDRVFAKREAAGSAGAIGSPPIGMSRASVTSSGMQIFSQTIQ